MKLRDKGALQTVSQILLWGSATLYVRSCRHGVQPPEEGGQYKRGTEYVKQEVQIAVRIIN